MYAYEVAYIASGEELTLPWMQELKKEKEKFKDWDYNTNAVKIMCANVRFGYHSYW